MKRFYILILTPLLSLNILAQNRSTTKQDVIQKTNGEGMKGRLTKITDTDVLLFIQEERCVKEISIV